MWAGPIVDYQNRVKDLLQSNQKRLAINHHSTTMSMRISGK
jgi:hypothetical protein